MYFNWFLATIFYSLQFGDILFNFTVLDGIAHIVSAPRYIQSKFSSRKILILSYNKRSIFDSLSNMLSILLISLALILFSNVLIGEVSNNYSTHFANVLSFICYFILRISPLILYLPQKKSTKIESVSQIYKTRSRFLQYQ